MVSVVASPAVILSDLFNPENQLARRWVIGYLVLATLARLADIGVAATVDRQNRAATAILSRYSALRGQVRDLPYAQDITFYAIRNDLDPSLVAAIIRVESDFDANARSKAGAKGLMQISPAVWRMFNPDSSCDGLHAPPATSSDCIYDPAGNIRTGAAYLRRLLDTFHGDFILAFAAYNAGAGTVQSAVARSGPSGDGLPPYEETRAFVRDVLNYWSGRSLEALTPTGAGFFKALPALRQSLPLVDLGAWSLLAVWLVVKWPRRRW